MHRAHRMLRGHLLRRHIVRVAIIVAIRRAVHVVVCWRCGCGGGRLARHHVHPDHSSGVLRHHSRSPTTTKATLRFDGCTRCGCGGVRSPIQQHHRPFRCWVFASAPGTGLVCRLLSRKLPTLPLVLFYAPNLIYTEREISRHVTITWLLSVRGLRVDAVWMWMT